MENSNINLSGDAAFGVKFIDPPSIINKIGVAEGMWVADFGCGTGYFTFPLARKVGLGGRVYSFDILKEKVETIESQAKLMGLNNIIVKRANLELENGSKLESGTQDWIFLVNILFQIPDDNKAAVLQEAKRALKVGGKILIIDWNQEDASFGPARNLKITEEEVAELAGKTDLSVLDGIKVGDFHFGIILAKNR